MKANLDKNLAPAWVSGKSYSTGEFCLYNKRLYICTTDNSDAEFDNSKWERRNLVDLVSGINSNLSRKPNVFTFVKNGLHNTDNVANVDTIAGHSYVLYFRDAAGAGAGRCDASKLTFTNANIVKALNDSDKDVYIVFVKATSFNITITGITDTVANYFVYEYSDDISIMKDLSNIVKVPSANLKSTYDIPCAKYAFVMAYNYSGVTASCTIELDSAFVDVATMIGTGTLTGFSTFQNSCKIYKSNSNFTVYNSCGGEVLYCY